MIEKYLPGKNSRRDFEKSMLEGSLQSEYDKYTGKKETDTLLLKPTAPKVIDSSEIEN